MSDKLNPGDRLEVDGRVTSQDGRYFLILQKDGNLVLYHSDGPKDIWATKTTGHEVSYAHMQLDGNFVVYGPRGEVVWRSRTNGYTGSFLHVQNDGNVVIYQNGTPIWSPEHEALIESIRWVSEQGPPTRDGEEGAGFKVWETTTSNPLSHPPARTGLVDPEQSSQGFWVIRVYRDNTSGTDCVRNAVQDARDGYRDHAVRWLCAGQAHNGAEQNLYQRNKSLTLQVLLMHFGHLG